jgi:hypothetical protein
MLRRREGMIMALNGFATLNCGYSRAAEMIAPPFGS